MTALAPPASIRIGPEGLPQHTLGWEILGWTKEYLLTPDGSRAGEPWTLTNEQARFILWWYAIDESGKFVYRRGMLRRMKGWGKDPLGATIAAVEFVAPCRFSHWKDGEPVAKSVYASWVQTAAVSRDQTRNTMTLFQGMFSERAKQEYSIDLGKELIYAHRGRCRIEAVTSSPRALEGNRTTFMLKNETQNWLTSNEGLSMAAVIARNSAKMDARVLAISNAHNPGEGSDAEADYDAWLKISAGQSRASGFLYDSVEAPADTVLSDDDSLREGIKAAAGDSWWVPVERLIEEIKDPKQQPSDSRRYYLNQIVAGEDAWLAPFEWDACADTALRVRLGEQITLGLDGSKSDDDTVLTGCRVDDAHLFPIASWHPADFPDGLIPTAQVDAAVIKAFEDYDVVGFYSDVKEWESYTDKWEQEFGENLCALSTVHHPIKWDMRRGKESTLAAESYHDAILERSVSHPNDPKLNQYHYNARRRPNQYGVSFSKESAFSSRKVDGVASSMLAHKARQDYMALPENKKRQADQYAGVTFA